ncbi:MAG: leucine-rich repeat domain-containing protein [Clostridia bacterium]|nr:leucine-rich repeat domain-containing protein [Clostridia bacterium]
MKKKLFFLSIFAVLITVLFAVGVSATQYDPGFGELEKIDFFENYAENNNGTSYISTVFKSPTDASDEARIILSCDCGEKHTYPTYYIIKYNQYFCFSKDFENINKYNKCNMTYTFDNVVALEVPEGIQIFYFENNIGMFQDCANLEYVRIPAGFKDLSKQAFKNCTALKYVSFDENVAITHLPDSVFNGCSSLLGICIPDTVKTIGNAAFISCYKLGPVHLSNSLETVANDTRWPVFHPENGNSTATTPFLVHMYFVNDTFDNPVGVEKPKVYYMPENLTQIWGHAFRGFHNVNDVIVFGEKFTKFEQNIGFTSMETTAENIKTFIFTADMESFYTYKGNNYLSFYFVNPNDIDADDIAVSSPAGGSGGNAMLYICAGGISKAVSSDEWVTDRFSHFADVETSEIVKEADCVNNAIISAKCYCGALMGEAQSENTALGHNHTIEFGIIYESYMEDGYYCLQCERCDDVIQGEKVDALFTCLGYSAPEDGRGGIAIVFTVNNVAIEAYEEATGKTLKYGVFAVLQSRLGDKDVFAQDGTVADGVINADITSYEFALFELKIVGFTDEYKDIKLAMGAYVAETDGETTEYSYLQSGTPNENEKYCFVSYNDIVGAPSNDEEVTQ